MESVRETLDTRLTLMRMVTEKHVKSDLTIDGTALLRTTGFVVRLNYAY